MSRSSAEGEEEGNGSKCAGYDDPAAMQAARDGDGREIRGEILKS